MVLLRLKREAAVAAVTLLLVSALAQAESACAKCNRSSFGMVRNIFPPRLNKRGS